MENTIAGISEKKCTGCGACMSSCSQNAIHMQPNGEGFLFPVIDTNKCVNCGKCLRTCPIVHEVSRNKAPRVYAVWADNETRMKSSSGGMMSILARYVLKKGGAVCGVAYSDDYCSVHHIWAENEDELTAIRGSKYLQSDTEKTFREAKQRLDRGQYVLYTGCPCQIAGLRNFLGKDYPCLITADIVCHGVPSPRVYKDYITELSAGKDLKKVDFREKSFWGWGTASSLFFSDGTTYRNDCYRDPYWKGFLAGVITRESCGTCEYAQINRVADFTLGDFWGINTIDPNSDDKKGTSQVLVNSSKGLALFEQLKDQMALVREQDIHLAMELAKTRNGNLLHPTRSHAKRANFFAWAAEEPFSKAYADAMEGKVKYKYDVGYVGWWDSKNYGSAMTCFAMNRTLKSMGYSVLMLEHPGMKPGVAENSYGVQFARKFYDCSQITAEKDVTRFNSVCENFIVGSDQLWNWWCCKDIGFEYYFLNFVYGNHRKIAYATSFGSDWTSFPENVRLKVSYYMNRFDAVSVREKSGVEICKRDFDVDAQWVLDPVFLCDSKYYDEVISLSQKSEKEPFLFAYILDPTDDKVKAVQKVAAERNLPYRIAIDGLGNKEKLRELLKNDPDIVTELRIEDWLWYLKNASFVVTDSFHGFCFSLIFRKNVIAYVNEHRGKARFDSIAEITGLNEFVVSSSDEIETRKLLHKEIDYTIVERRLQPQIVFCRDWLQNAITAKKLLPSAKELQLWKILEHDEKINRLEEKISELQEENRNLRKETSPRKSCFDWLVRKTKGGIRCLRENGLKYTVRHFFRKVKDKLAG